MTDSKAAATPGVPGTGATVTGGAGTAIDWGAITIPVIAVNGELMAGLAANADASLAATEKLPYLRDYGTDDAKARAYKAQIATSIDWGAGLPDGIVHLLDVGAYICLDAELYLWGTSVDGDAIEVSAAGGSPTRDRVVSLIGMLSSPERLGQAYGLILATKVEWWKTNHHVGQSNADFTGYAYKMATKVFGDFSNDVSAVRTALHRLGHFASTRRVLAAAGVHGIAWHGSRDATDESAAEEEDYPVEHEYKDALTLGPTEVETKEKLRNYGMWAYTERGIAERVDHHLNLPTATEDVVIRLKSPPAGTAAAGLCQTALSIWSRGLYTVAAPAFTDLDNVMMHELDLAQASYHIGASYLMMDTKIHERVSQPVDATKAAVALFVHIAMKGSTLSKAKVLMPLEDAAAIDSMTRTRLQTIKSSLTRGRLTKLQIALIQLKSGITGRTSSLAGLDDALVITADDYAQAESIVKREAEESAEKARIAAAGGGLAAMTGL